jgi:hypothetical protein
MFEKQKSGCNIEDPKCREKQGDATVSVIFVGVVILLIFCLTLVWLYWKS